MNEMSLLIIFFNQDKFVCDIYRSQNIFYVFTYETSLNAF